MGRLLPFVSVVLVASGVGAGEPTAHLLNMGQAPQAPLQTSTADVVRSLALVIETRVSMRVGEMEIPTAGLPPIEVSLAWRAAAGKSELVIEGVEVRPDAGANVVVTERLRAATAALIGKKLSETGELPAPVVATLAELRAVLDHLMVPMPLEPVGLGAQWELIRTVRRRGVEAVERVVYELLERDGQTLRVRVAIDVGANPQDVDGAKLTALEGSGSGEVVLRLDRPGPVNGTMTLESTSKLREGKKDLVLRTETRVTLSSL